VSLWLNTFVLQSQQRHTYCTAADTREQSTALSGISRANRHSKLSIQRLAPSNPPVISAGNMQILQKLQLVSTYSISILKPTANG
jgi:hypothetical protein